MQRVTAVALVPLTIWFVVSIIRLLTSAAAEGADPHIQPHAIEWLSHPFNAVMCILFIIAMFYHGALGIREVFEDYVSNKCIKLSLIIIMNLACFATAVAGIFAVLSISFSG